MDSIGRHGRAAEAQPARYGLSSSPVVPGTISEGSKARVWLGTVSRENVAVVPVQSPFRWVARGSAARAGGGADSRGTCFRNQTAADLFAAHHLGANVRRRVRRPAEWSDLPLPHRSQEQETSEGKRRIRRTSRHLSGALAHITTLIGTRNPFWKRNNRPC